MNVPLELIHRNYNCKHHLENTALKHQWQTIFNIFFVFSLFKVESVLENSRRLGDGDGAEVGAHQLPERSPSKVTFDEEQVMEPFCSDTKIYSQIGCFNRSPVLKE